MSPANEILFGGASEGGKSHLVRVALVIWCMAVPQLQCVLIRRKWTDILANHLEGPTGFRVLLAPIIALGQAKITREAIRFSNGSIILFVHCQDERQFDTAQGTEKHVLVVDEATQVSERLIRFFRTWCRVPKDWKESLPPEWRNTFPRILYTANPFGPSAPFFRRNFVKARAAMAIEDVEGFRRQYIPSRAEDNLSVDLALHKARLDGMHDPGLARALDVGDWDAPIGEFFPHWDETRHVTPDFKPPRDWFKLMTFDWGSADPFCVLWWCVSDGQEFTDGQGRTRWFRRGALICYREWYGCDPKDPAKGCQMRNEDIAAGIKARTLEDTSGLIVTDSLPFQDRGMSRDGKPYNIADVFSDAGCKLTMGNVARITGWTQLRDRLIGKDGDPLLLVTESCRFVRDYLPAIGRNPTNPEDAESDGEATHAADCVRYACTTRPIIKDQKPALPPPPKDGSICPAEILTKLKTQTKYPYYARR